jgi:hypothetical protein
MRVGICGYAGSGKDVVADVLVTEYGFVRVNMSDALDRYLQVLNPWVHPAGFVHLGDIRYADLRGLLNYTEAKRIPEVRRLLQALGTDVGRAIDPEMWLKELEKEAARHDKVVTTGIRFLNEAAPLDYLVHVERPGVGPANDHVSESIDPIIAISSITLRNDGTIEDLQNQVREKLRWVA